MVTSIQARIVVRMSTKIIEGVEGVHSEIAYETYEGLKVQIPCKTLAQVRLSTGCSFMLAGKPL